jgi:hypothetical protein
MLATRELRALSLSVGALIATIGCTNNGCVTTRVVTAPSSGGLTVNSLELDNGQVYRPLSSVYAPQWTSGRPVRLCDFVSKIDGRHHYSVKNTGLKGEPTEVELVR